MSTNHSAIFRDLCLFASIASSLASVANIIVICDMIASNIWNGHLALITAMTVYQLIYDVTFYDNNIHNVTSTTFLVCTLFQIWGGVAQALISNEIALAVLYIIWYRRPFNIFQNFVYLMSAANLPALALCCMYYYDFTANQGDSSLQSTSTTSSDIPATIFSYGYCCTRIASIAAIFVTYTYTSYLVGRLNSQDSFIMAQENAIKTLVARMKYYPVVQALSRIGYIWYESVYGYNFNPPNHNTSNQQFAAQLLIALLSPINAIGYFLIFLSTQPHAWQFFKCRLTTGRRYRPAEDQQSSFIRPVNREDNGYYTTAADEVLYNIMGEESTHDETSFRTSLLSH